jgi:hypothetical protein
MKKALLLTTAIIFSLLMVNAQTQVLTGKIGAYPVIMELNVHDDSMVEANYFYVKYRKNTSLSGQKNNGDAISMTSFFRNESDKPDAEKIELVNMGSTYTGSWSLDKKKLRIELQPIDMEKYKSPYDELEFVKKLKKDNPYQYALISAFVFNKDSSFSIAGYKVDRYKEKYTHVPMVQLRNDTNDPAIARVNTRLKENSLDECIMESLCGETSRNYDYSTSINSIFIGGDVFSINACVNYYCGGAYPDAGCNGLSWSLKTGELIRLEDVIWFGNEMSAADAPDAGTYTDSVFAPAIVKLFETLYPAEMKDAGGTCEYNNPAMWGSVNWYFTAEGLYVGPVYPHYGLACSEPGWSVIPYDIVKKYRNPKNGIRLPGK